MATNIGSQRESGILDMVGLESIISYKDKNYFANASVLFQKKAKARNYSSTGSHISAIPDFVCHISSEKEIDKLVKGLWFGLNLSYSTKQVGQMRKGVTFSDTKWLIDIVLPVGSVRVAFVVVTDVVTETVLPSLSTIFTVVET